MILIGNFFASFIRITFMVVTSELIKSSDSFGMANSFNASGKYVLLAFFRRFSQNRENRVKLKTFSFVDDRDVFLEDFS